MARRSPQDLTRNYAWFSALIQKDTALMEDLLSHGVPVDVLHPLRHSTALMEATRLGRAELVHWLLEHGAAPAFLSGTPAATALHVALRMKQWEIATILTEKMENCAILDMQCSSLLHVLCAESYAQPDPELLLGLATVFIAKGCPLDALDYEGVAALHHCAINDQLALAELLLEHQANPNARIPDSGVSPLTIAALEHNLEMAQLLMRFGADPNLPTRDGSTAMELFPALQSLYMHANPIEQVPIGSSG